MDEADPTPANKRKGPSLREMERQIEKDRYNHILSNGGEYTVLSLAEKYISLKTGVRINTETGYKTLNTYTHVQYEDAEKEMKRLYGIV